MVMLPLATSIALDQVDVVVLPPDGPTRAVLAGRDAEIKRRKTGFARA
jgi:hypothetical protein